MTTPARLPLQGMLLVSSLLTSTGLVAGTIDFEGSEYTTGQTVVGVNDADIVNTSAWQRYGLADTSAAMIASTARPATGSRALRIQDASASQAYVVYLDTAGEVVPTQPFSISFDLALSGPHATTGTLQAQIQFGRSVASQWNDFKSWLHLDLHGNDVRVFVYDSSAPDKKKPVTVAQHGGAYLHVSAVVDPATKTYASLVINGVDVTTRVQAVNGGALPSRPDISGDPDLLFWATTGTDDLVTLDIDNIRIAQSGEPWISAASEEWLPYLTSTSPILVRGGSALDFSGLNTTTASTIDARGFAFVGRDGDLAFSDGTKARLLCAAESVDWLPFDLASEIQMDAYVTQLKRAGYNCFRPHFLDHFLMQGATADRILNPDRLEVWHRLVKKLKDAGIYLLMDATTSWSSYYSTSNLSPQELTQRNRLKTRLYWDQSARDHWLAAVNQIYTETNLLTNTALKDDPQVIASCLRNEPGLVFQLQNDKLSNPALAQEPGLLAAWRDWLKTVQTDYADAEALSAAWSIPVGQRYTSFDAVPLPSPDYPAQNFAPYRTLHKFAVHLEQTTFQWLLQSFNGLGVRSLALDYNCDPSLPASMSRDTQALVDFHSYHDHGYASPSNGYYWVHDNTSSADRTLAYVRLAAQARQWGRPFTVTEWGHVYWNPWRHEGGLAFPGYAALQGWSLIAQHGHPVALSPKVVDHFNIYEDPPRKASERMAALLYARGDVATSPHRVEAVVAPTNSNYTNNLGIMWPLANAALLTRVGLRLDWPRVVHDDFEDSLLHTLTERNDSSVPAYFWNASTSSGSTNSSVGTSGGALLLRAADLTYPSAVAWGGVSSSAAFNFFENQVVFVASGIAFDPASPITAAKQVLRFALTSNVNQTYGAPDCLTLEIRADNKVVLGYKVDAPNTGVLNIVESITDISGDFSAIEGFSFNPNAAYLNEFASPPSDPTYDLVIHYRAAPDKPAYRRFTGRWKKQPSFPALTRSAWGAAGNSHLQFEAQKADGVTGGWIKAEVREFTVSSYPSGPVGATTLPAADLSLPVPSSLSFADIVQTLRSGGVLPSDNQTVAASSSSAHDGIYHSDTGELWFEPQSRLFRVVTPRSEGGTLPSATAELSLPHLRATNLPAPNLPAPVSILLSSLDPTKTVKTSSRLLLILSSDALNSGQKFADHRRLAQLQKPVNDYAERGSLPILLRRAKVDLRLENDHKASLKVYPLAPDGERRAPLPVSFDAEGRLRCVIDTGLIDGAPAVYFELAP